MKLRIELIEEDCEFIEKRNNENWCDFIGGRCWIKDFKNCVYYKEKYIKNCLSLEEIKQIIKNNKNKEEIVTELLDVADFKRG